MNISTRTKRRRFSSLWAACALATVAAIFTATRSTAQTSVTDVYRVEEDWKLVVGDPDVLADGPQVTCTISPADMATAYCAFDINYHTQPDYSVGGLQIHTWDPVDPIEYANSIHTGQMQTSGETVTWTTRMSWSPGYLQFIIVNGQSQTWGSFGGVGNHLTLSLPTTLSNLDGYSPQVSIDNSGISFASNLVQSLTLVAVRWYDINGKLIQQVTTPQAVYPQ